MNSPENTKKICLNIGSSCYLLDGFTNIDNNAFACLEPIFPLIRPFLRAKGRMWLETLRKGKLTATFKRANCRKPLPFQGGTVDHILASHFLEHLYHGNAKEVLADWHRLLKPGGTLHVIVPDLQSRIMNYVNRIGDPEAAGDFFTSLTVRDAVAPPKARALRTLLFDGDIDHCWMYDDVSLRAILQESGFEILPTIEGPSADWRRNDPDQVNLVARKMTTHPTAYP
jgi:predicted SAM-dependent methyltransferase